MSEAIAAAEPHILDVFEGGYAEAEAVTSPDHIALAGVAQAVGSMQTGVRAAITREGRPGVPADQIEMVRGAVTTALERIDEAEGLHSPRRLAATAHLHAAVAEARLAGGRKSAALGHVMRGLVRLPGSGNEPLADAEHPPVTAGMLLRTGGYIITESMRRTPHPEDDEAVRRQAVRQEAHHALLNHGRKIKVR
jgi:hypothetical protein